MNEIKSLQNDPQYYFIKTNCINNNEFKEKIGIYRYVYGDKIPIVLSFTSINNITNYFNNNQNCYKEYEIMHPLLKIASVVNIDNDKFIIDSEITNNIDSYEYQNNLNNRISEFINSNINDGRLLEESTSLNYTIIYNDIIKYSHLKRQLNDLSEDIIIKKDIKTMIHIENNVINEVLSFLCMQNEISIISPDYPVFFNEDKIVRHGLRNLAAKSFLKCAQSLTRCVESVWNHNITGSGEIIGAGDTGVDLNHKMFYDEDHPFVYNETNEDHRKVYFYYPYRDNKEVHPSHGLGVCTFINGVLDNDIYSLAYNSKLFFFDAQQGSNSISVPYNYKDEYFSIFKLYTNVSSNSWGSRYYYYTTRAHDVDDYCYNNKDFLVLFAAGNDGKKSGITVLAEGQAKNVITVGSTYRDGVFEKYITYIM